MLPKTYLDQMMKKLYHRARQYLSPGMLAWLLILVGVALRFVRYLANRSLWLDEIFLAQSIVNRTFLGLWQPLDYNQYAPVGFLMLEKLAVQIFGNTEYALRLFPLLFGVLSLVLLYQLSRQLLEPKATLIVLGLAAIGEHLVFYSAEVKQYSSDVFVALVVFVVTLYVKDHPLSQAHLALLGIAGAVAIWFSQPVVFVLAGAWTTLVLSYLTRREHRQALLFGPVGLLWLASYAAFFLVSARPFLSGGYDAVASTHLTHFLPFPPTSFQDLNWMVTNFLAFFADPVGLYLSGLAALTFLVGCCVAWQKHSWDSLILTSPMLFALVASALKVYPFWGRLALFTVPSALILIAEGAMFLIEQTRHTSGALRYILVALLFVPPLMSAKINLATPPGQEEIQDAMSYVAERWQEGDLLYVYYGAQPAFLFYLERYGFQEEDYVLGISSRTDVSRYVLDLEQLQDKERVWVLFSHVCTWMGVDEEQYFLNHLDTVGRQLDAYQAPGAALYLYSLRARNRD